MNILIVDDDKLICENVKSKLGRIAAHSAILECRAVQNVTEARLAIREQIPDILITDINMPGISGLTLISYTKQNYPQVRIFVLSGYDDYQLVRQAFVNGAADYLLKPVEIRELQEKVFRTEVSVPAEEKQPCGDFQMQSAIGYIEKNLSRELTMDEVASSIAMSYNYFSRKFREYTGYSFPEYVNLRRIELAKTYLKDPSVKISDIAYKIGYQSASTFSRTFNKYEGCYPADYRRIHGIAEETVKISIQ